MVAGSCLLLAVGKAFAVIGLRDRFDSCSRLGFLDQVLTGCRLWCPQEVGLRRAECWKFVALSVVRVSDIVGSR